MRAAALPAVIVGAVLQATPVRPVSVRGAPAELVSVLPTEGAPSEETEEADDDFVVRLSPGAVRAAFERVPSSLRGDLRSRREGPACPVLGLQGSATRRFYFRDTCNGLGSRILDVVGALILAEKMGLRFAGVVPHCPESHGTTIAPAMQAFFGFANESDMYVDTLPNGTLSFPSLRDLQEQLEKGAIGDGTAVLLDSGDLLPNFIFEDYVSPAIWAALRSRGTPLMHTPLTYFSPYTFNVAVHVRRDDVFSSSSSRFTADKWYIWLMDIMREKMPHAAFHIFSSLGTRNHSKAGRRLPKSEDFDVYRNWGATVHLDTEALETMAHMARAEVLVTAKSSFSYVAALLNPNCVLFQKWLKAMPDWVQLPLTHQVGDKTHEVLSQTIASCMDGEELPWGTVVTQGVRRKHNNNNIKKRAAQR